MDKVFVAMAGGFGGIAPSLVDKARSLQSGEAAKWLRDGDDVLFALLCGLGAMAVFFLIGSAVALIYKESVLSKAMLLGIGAPALIMAAAAAGGSGQTVVDLTPAGGVSGGLNLPALVSRAYAQQPDAATAKDFELIVNPPAGGGCKACSIQVLGKDQQLLAVQQLDNASAATTLSLPEDAATIVFSGADTNSATIDVESLPPQVGGAVALDIGRDRNYWNDLQRSFGNRSVQPYDFKVQLQK
ncbi:hypothetical protein DFR52_101932 [Hoeflea marina]|uniref:Uncharacterized protein n=2 Tax=Hoeflea marina TaxID=274592 RepID=A0A317PRZ7_9HYPH|nr:hypothetical protein DFR52_101932 [Hoeflea marina]